ncbi:PepSY-like domain-containing protein [Campylobacter jejuni]|nr:PepSY-like domain-containing protein [Campylobacter jejuni]
MKTKFILAILACSVILASANIVPTASVQTPAAAPAPVHPYPAYPQQAVPPQDYFNGLPKNITSQIQNLYPGAFIVDIDWEAYGYEVKLNNYMELYFDRNGNFLGQEFDD